MINKIYLCSFASSDLDKSVKRFKKQAKEMNVYEKINIYRPNNLSNELKSKVDKLLKSGKKKIICLCNLETKYYFKQSRKNI